MADFRSSAAYRIAVPYAAFVAWIVLLLGVTVYFAADAEMRRHRDVEIAEELDRLSRQPSRSELRRELRSRQVAPTASRFRYALFDANGKRTGGELQLPRPASGFHDLAVSDRDGPGRTARVGAVDLADGSRLIVAADFDTNSRLSGMIFKFFVFVFFAVLVISAVGGLLLRRYLRDRLKPIGATADAIVTGDIEWRVPVGKHGDEFDAAGRAVNLMLDRIAGLIENLRQVSSDIAHDLRKPLMRLLLQTDRLGKVDGAEQRVHELGDEMLMLFASILRIAEVEGGGLERSFEHVNLSTLVGEVAESFAPALADAGDSIDWMIEPNVTVFGNRELIAQLVANLLDNARIHTPPGTAINIALASDGGSAKLLIEDNGPGVREEDLEKLSQRFFRTEASRTTPGNGLGLSLVAAVARAHSGTVAIGGASPGLRITVTLPQLGEDAPLEERPARRASGFLRRWFQ